jgi:hypothetical protein
MTHLRKMMLEELERRNYAQTTIDCYRRSKILRVTFVAVRISSLRNTFASTKRICSARESWLHPP